MSHVNRLLIAGMLLKQSRRGQSPLFENAPISGFAGDIKRFARTLIGMTIEECGDAIEEQQEVAAVSDIVMEAFAIESVMLREAKIAGSGRQSLAADLSKVYREGAMARIRQAARTVIAACCGAPSAPVSIRSRR